MVGCPSHMSVHLASKFGSFLFLLECTRYHFISQKNSGAYKIVQWNIKRVIPCIMHLEDFLIINPQNPPQLWELGTRGSFVNHCPSEKV